MSKKYISKFVIHQQALQERLRIKRYYWISRDKNGLGLTYVRAKHGELYL